MDTRTHIRSHLSWLLLTHKHWSRYIYMQSRTPACTRLIRLYLVTVDPYTAAPTHIHADPHNYRYWVMTMAMASIKRRKSTTLRYQFLYGLLWRLLSIVTFVRLHVLLYTGPLRFRFSRVLAFEWLRPLDTYRGFPPHVLSYRCYVDATVYTIYFSRLDVG